MSLKTKTANILLTLGLIVILIIFWSEKTFSVEIILTQQYQFIKLFLILVGAILFSVGFLNLWANAVKKSNED